MDPREDIFGNGPAGACRSHDTARDENSVDGDVLDDDASTFSCQSLARDLATDIYDRRGLCPASDRDTEAADLTCEVGAVPDTITAPQSKETTSQPVAAQPASHGDQEARPDQAPTNPAPPHTKDDQSTIPRGRSIAHEVIREGKVVYVSFDIETGGEHCGILQLSAEMIRIELVPKQTKKGESSGGDTAKNIRRLSSTFNSFVNPGEGAIFAPEATAVHGLHSSDHRISSAEKIEAVWAKFCRWLDENMSEGESAVLVAWNG